MKRLSKWIVGLSGGAALVVGVALHQNQRDLRDEVNALSQQVVEAQEIAEAALTAVIPADVIQAIDPSVYAIAVDGKTVGTAFVVDQENGILLTAAHVTKGIEQLKTKRPDLDVTIINRHAPAPVPVTNWYSHAGYGAFREEVARYGPIDVNSTLERPRILPLRDFTLDAAILTVNPLADDGGGPILAPAIPFADETAIDQLQPGMPIAVIGFPYDVIDGELQHFNLTSRAERGTIAALIAPIDSVANLAAAGARSILVHRMATAGGNSGSPIVNRHGQVVAMHTHGVRLNTGNADGAGQRADILAEVLRPDHGSVALYTRHLPQWRAGLSSWPKLDQVLPWSYYIEHEKNPSGQMPAQMVDAQIGELDLSQSPPFESSVQEAEFSDDSNEIKIGAKDLAGQQSVTGEGGDDATSAPGIRASHSSDTPFFNIKKSGAVYSHWVTVERSKHTVLYAVDYTTRRSLGFCSLEAYWRKEGQENLRRVRARPVADLYLPALSAAQAVSERYQVVYRRKRGCDPDSKAFVIGQVTWSPSEPPLLASATFGHDFVTTPTVRFVGDEQSWAARLMHGAQNFCSKHWKFGGCIQPRAIPVSFDENASD